MKGTQLKKDARSRSHSALGSTKDTHRISMASLAFAKAQTK